MYARVHVFSDKLKHLPSLIALMFRKILVLTSVSKETCLLFERNPGYDTIFKEAKRENVLQCGVPMWYQCGLCLSYISSGGLCFC